MKIVFRGEGIMHMVYDSLQFHLPEYDTYEECENNLESDFNKPDFLSAEIKICKIYKLER